MTAEELERQVMALRSRPLLVLARTPSGKERVMDVRECVASGSAYVSIAADELDRLLGAALGGDNAPVS